MHIVEVDLSKAVQGENTYTCIDCQKPIVLVWDGVTEGGVFTPTSWSLTHDDQWDNPVGNVQVRYL